MKKVVLLFAVVATLGFVSCKNAQTDAEKAKQDSLAEVARLDSIAKAQADSLASVVDTLQQEVEEVTE